MFPLNGEYNSCQISASEDIIIIIDGRVLIQGVWKGFKALMQHYPHARRIWLTRRDLENFIHMAAIEILISIPIWQSLFLLSISLNTLVQTK